MRSHNCLAFGSGVVFSDMAVEINFFAETHPSKKKPTVPTAPTAPMLSIAPKQIKKNGIRHTNWATTKISETAGGTSNNSEITKFKAPIGRKEIVQRIRKSLALSKLLSEIEMRARSIKFNNHLLTNVDAR